MAGSGFSSIGNFRKMMSATAKKSKYESVVRTPSDIERDDLQAEMEEQMRMEAEAEAKEADDSDDVDAEKLKKRKNYNVDDITKDLDNQMKISKKKGASKQNAGDFEMDLGKKTIKKGEKIGALRKKRKMVRSRS